MVIRPTVLILFLVLVAGCGASAKHADAPAGNAQRGAHLFIRDRCVVCHVANGVGGQVGPELTNYPPATDFGSLTAILEDPPPQMATGISGEHFSAQNVRDLNAFFRSTITPKG